MKLEPTCLKVIKKIQTMLTSGYSDIGVKNEDIWNILNSNKEIFWNLIEINSNEDEKLESICSNIIFYDFAESQIEFENLIIHFEANKKADMAFMSKIMSVVNKRVSDNSNVIFSTSINGNIDISNVEIFVFGSI